jgi:hypothetical protein
VRVRSLSAGSAAYTRLRAAAALGTEPTTLGLKVPDRTRSKPLFSRGGEGDGAVRAALLLLKECPRPACSTCKSALSYSTLANAGMPGCFGAQFRSFSTLTTWGQTRIDLYVDATSHFREAQDRFGAGEGGPREAHARRRTARQVAPTALSRSPGEDLA